MVPQASAKQYRSQQAVAATTVASADLLWRRMTNDFDASWALIRPNLLQVVEAGRARTVDAAIPYTDAVLAETEAVAPATGSLSKSAFLAAGPDGREVSGLLDLAPIRLKQAVAAGMAVEVALESGRKWLTQSLLTTMADTRREVYQADIVQRPNLHGYTRMLNTPSCRDCTILAGRWFRWNEGFDRHPNCDCIHIPANEDVAGDYRTDPYLAFQQLTEAEQDKEWGRSEARAIRDGADIYKVYGQSRGKMLGANTRVDRIYRTAGTRTNAIKMLEERGFILPRGQQRVTRSKHILTDAQILAQGRGLGTVKVFGVTTKTARASRYDAALTGVRDPLVRSTMTAAERRLYDASYKLNYARMTGNVAPSVGVSKANYSLAVKPVTPVQLRDLEADLARQLKDLNSPRTPESMRRLARALGLI